jgi:hypothetical protein
MSFFHPLASIRASVLRIEDALGRPTRKEIEMSAALDHLTTEVAQVKTLAQSAVTLITGLAQQIRDGASDPAAMEALATDLETSLKPLSDALVANTPVAPSGLGAGPVLTPPAIPPTGFASSAKLPPDFPSSPPFAPPAGALMGTNVPADSTSTAAQGGASITGNTSLGSSAKSGG